MQKSRPVNFVLLIVLIPVLAILDGERARAHCDSLDGPVVKAAQRALDTGNLDFVLIWVQERDEAEVRTAYKKTLAVRKLGQGAKELADTYFFETVVRLHRAGEGAPYTGLKPAGRDLGPAIPAADQAIEDGSPKRIQRLLTHAVEEGISKRFGGVIVRKTFQPNDIESGREYVKAYVQFVHYVEAIHEAANNTAHHHDGETTATARHDAGENHRHK